MSRTPLSLSPAEAATVTGVSPATQRDWRRRVSSARSPGWTRFDAEGLAELWLLKVLAASGKMKDGADAAKALASPLGRYFQASADGVAAPCPADVAVIWADGSVTASDTIQGAFDAATGEQQSSPATILSLQALAVPLWIKLRDYLEQESGGEQ